MILLNPCGDKNIFSINLKTNRRFNHSYITAFDILPSGDLAVLYNRNTIVIISPKDPQDIVKIHLDEVFGGIYYQNIHSLDKIVDICVVPSLSSILVKNSNAKKYLIKFNNMALINRYFTLTK